MNIQLSASNSSLRRVRDLLPVLVGTSGGDNHPIDHRDPSATAVFCSYTVVHRIHTWTYSSSSWCASVPGIQRVRTASSSGYNAGHLPLLLLLLYESEHYEKTQAEICRQT